MPEPTIYPQSPARSHPSPRPLQTPERYREARVEAQIARLRDCPLAEILRRAQGNDESAPGFVYAETLTYLLREHLRSGQTEPAWKIAEALLARVASYVAGEIRKWPSFAGAHGEDCQRDIYHHLYEALFDLSAKSEFWEVRFWCCLHRSSLNCAKKYQRLTQNEMHVAPFDEDGEDFLARLPDNPGLSTQDKLELNEALSQLDHLQRAAFLLFYQENWPQQKIARYFNVDDRTIRNWLTRARKRLQEFYND